MERLAAGGATTAILFLLITTSIVVMESSPARASAVTLTGRYIMAFLACDTSVKTCSDPQQHTTYFAESNDSVSWVPVPGFRPYLGSVPDAIRRGSTVYFYNPGTVVRFGLGTGSQSAPAAVSLKFANGTSSIFVDPSLYLDSSGVLHLFYLPGIMGQDPASCPVGHSTCTKYIMSASEVAGSDGGSFVVDSGQRAAYQVNGCCFSDPAVFHAPGAYYLYVSDGQSVVAFESSTLTGTYSQVQGLSQGVLVPQGTGGVPAGYYDNASMSFWTFITHGSKVSTIDRASTSNIDTQIGSSSFSTVISGCTFQGLGCTYTVESPAMHLNTPGLPTTSTTSSSSTAASSSVSSATTSITSSSASSVSQASSTTSTSSSTTTVTATTSMSSTQSTHATQSTQTSSGPGSGGGIPEFPYQLSVSVILSALVVASYFVFRTQKLRRSGAGMA